ncbi:MAG: ATP-binding protein [Patescibacteria group bacterium]
MNQILSSIPIVIKDQHTLLNRIAEGYQSIEKVLMEYIDNSLDSAEIIFDEDTKRYGRDISITVAIDRKNNTVSIRDNCEGMDKITVGGLANKVNESGKPAQARAWVTGRFGLGIHAFRLVAQALEVTSQCKGAEPTAIVIDKDRREAELFKPTAVGLTPSGTLVQLCGVEKTRLKHLNPVELAKEIEIYFEGFLWRNLKIIVVDGDTSYACEPYDYEKLKGIEINEVITTWNAGKTRIIKPTERGIIVHLKICTEEGNNRAPYFACKGRRISYIPQLDSFIAKTEHRRKVWGHHLLTGYIEVQDNLEPVITRDDFAGGTGRQQNRTGIYEEVVKLEDKIHDAIEAVNNSKSDESFRNLASRLTDILSDLAKEEELNLRYQQNGDKNKKGEKEPITPDPNGLDYKVDKKIIYDGPGPIHPNPHKEIINAISDPDGSVEGTKIEKEKQGIRIEFSQLPSPLRTHYGDSVITIFVKHKDFQDRKGDTQLAELGSMKITARLANYLAAIISSEFKEVFYQQKHIEPPRADILNQQIDFIFKMEDRMKDFIDKPLQSIGIIK